MPPSRFKRLELAVAICAASLTMHSSRAQDLPQGADVTHGRIDIDVQGQHMQVQQGSQYGIVNWDTFSIGAGYHVDFDNGSGATLNRVTGTDVSHIYGQLTASGSVYLLNSNGIVIGEGGQVLTGGHFIGSTLDIQDSDFLDGGGFSLFGEASSGVTNLGKISSSGGNVLLAGYTVENRGEISAPQGHAGLAAGTRVDVLTDTSWAGGAFAVKLGERDSSVSNEGRIQAMVAELRTHNGNIYALAGNNTGLIQATGVRSEGGKVFLTAEDGLVQSSGVVSAVKADGSGGDIEISAQTIENYGGVQDVSGSTGGRIALTADSIISDTTMRADGTDGDGGVITLEAEDQALLTSAGSISAQGSASGGEIAVDGGSGKTLLSGSINVSGGLQGGRVSLWGQSVSMFGGSILAEGGALGGEVYLGGGWQGRDIWQGNALLETSNSQSTYLSETSHISVDARQLGKGGTVAAWSDGITQFAGKITARGGLLGGDGGMVETSGLDGLGVSGDVDAGARAPYGTNGAWLLDPKNITISETAAPLEEFRRVLNEPGARAASYTTWNFGQDVDISGNTFIVSTRESTAQGRSAGGVYVFEDGRFSALLTSGLSSTVDFGKTIAIAGDFIAASAPGDRQTIEGTISQYRGSISFFHRGDGWKNGTQSLLSKQYNPYSKQTNDFSTDDWGAALVGAERSGNTYFYISNPLADLNSINGEDAGTVLVYSCSSPTFCGSAGELTAETKVADQRYGTSLAADGDVVAIGSTKSYHPTLATNQLDVFVGFNRLNLTIEGFGSIGGFDVDDRTLVVNSGDSFRQFDLSLGDSGTQAQQSAAWTIAKPVNLWVANRIAVSGDTLLVENGSTSSSTRHAIYQRPSAGWNSCPESDCAYSLNITLSGERANSFALDGDLAIIGQQDWASGAGRINIFTRHNGTWGYGETLGATQLDYTTEFGDAVAIDGDTWVVGDSSVAFNATNEGAAYIFENGSLAARLGRRYPRFISGSSYGFGLDVGIDGSTVAVISPGDAYIFEKGAGWKNGTTNLTGYKFFGSNTVNSLSLDNNLLAVGFTHQSKTTPGQVKLFQNSGTGWQSALDNALASLMPSTSQNSDGFGIDVALDGNTLLVGQASTDNSITQRAFIFENTSNDWSTAVETILNRGLGANNDLSSGLFGGSVALDGNLAVVGFGTQFGNVQQSSTTGAYVFEKQGSWAASSQPAARLQVNHTGFGAAVAVDNGLIGVSAFPGNNSVGGAVYLFKKQGGWQDGSNNLIASLAAASSGGSDRSSIGYSLAISGDKVVSGGTPATAPGSNPWRAGFLYQGPFDVESRFAFGNQPGDTLSLKASSLAGALSLGTDITLQANNDINVIDAITVNNPDGNGGKLTLEAGRSILVNASITTDSGDLHLLAGSPNANATYRDSGEARVLVGTDSNNNSATLNLGSGNLLINAPDRFENRALTNNIFRFDATNPGVFRVFSKTPDNTGAISPSNLRKNLDITGRDFVHYNKTFDYSNPIPDDLPTGSGFFYTIRPSIRVSVGDSTATFGDEAVATLQLDSATLDGNDIDADAFGITASGILTVVKTAPADHVSKTAGGFAEVGSYTDGLIATLRQNVTTGSLFGVDVTAGEAGDLTVTKKSIRAIVDNVTREYGTANPQFTFTFKNLQDDGAGLVAGDTVSVFDTPLTVTTDAALDTDVRPQPFDLVAGGGADNNYDVTLVDGLLTIVQQQLQVTGLSAQDRVYDATASATLSGAATIAPLAGDDISLGGTLTATASFASKHVGNDKPVTISGLQLNGADAPNYALVLPNLTASITALALNPTGLSAADRVYDNTTQVSLSGTPSIAPIQGDDVSLAGTVSGSFSDRNAGINKPVRLTGLTLDGADAGNYTLNLSDALFASISPRELQVTGLTAQDKVYDETLRATTTGTATVTALGEDQVQVGGTALFQFSDRHVGTNKVVTASGFTLHGAHAGNYTLLQPTGLTASITPRDVVVTGLSVVDRIYDGTAAARLVGNAGISTFGQDDVTLQGDGTALFADKHVGSNKAVTVNGFSLTGAHAGNYNLLQPSGLSASILARPLSVSGITISNRAYDGTINVSFTGDAAVSGALDGDDLSIDSSGFTLNFLDKNVGTDKKVRIGGVALSGADAANYDATDAGLVASITPRLLDLLDVNVADKIYDRTTSATVTGGRITGILTGDSLSLLVSERFGIFSDKNVGQNKTVTIAGFSLTGSSAGNYALNPLTLNASITPHTLNITGLNGDKTYDGQASTTLRHNGLDSAFVGDDVSLDGSAVSAAFADKHAGANKNLSLTGSFTLQGNDASNYLLNQPGALTGTISKRNITVDGLTIADKVYDGTTTAEISGTGTFGGAIAGDDLAINVGEVDVQFADKNAGNNKPVAMSGVTLSGADAENYSAATPTGLTASITPKALTVSGIGASDKVYDLTTSATLTGTGVIAGRIDGDLVTLDESARSGSFADRHVGEDKVVTVSGLALAGNDRNNYVISPVSDVTASITPATVSLTGLTAINRVYDATTLVNLDGVSTLDFGTLGTLKSIKDDLSLLGTPVANMNDKHVGDNKALTVSGVTLGGQDAGNYTLNLPTTLSANITPLELTVVGLTAVDREYNGDNIADLSGTPSAAFKTGDAVSISGSPLATFDSKDVGARTVNVTGFELDGDDASNYRLKQPEPLNASISPYQLVLQGVVADDKIYDGTTVAPLSGSLSVSPLGGDSVTVSGQPVATFASKNVGDSIAVTLSGLGLSGGGSNNYIFTIPELQASITPRTLTVSGITAMDKVYDGTTAASFSGTATLPDVVSGDAVDFDASILSGSFRDKNVGDGKLVTVEGGGLSGTDAGNYLLQLPGSLTASITPKPLSITGISAADRVYDGTTTVSVSGGNLEGMIDGDAVQLSAAGATGTLSDPDAGDNKPVTVAGFSVTGADFTNYSLAEPEGVTVNILQRLLEISGVQVADKFFDGNTSATVSGGNLQGVISGDDVGLVGANISGEFADPEVGDNKPVILSGFDLTGSDAGNYSLGDAPSTTGNIKRELQLITDVVPPEVLRAQADTNLEAQRETLTAMVNAQADAVTVVEYEAATASVFQRVAAAPVNNSILATPPEQQDTFTQTYVAAAQTLQQRQQEYAALETGYRSEARYLKSLTQTFNQVQRDLQVASALIPAIESSIAGATAALADLDTNLAEIQEARERLAEYTQLEQEALATGRGAEAAQYREMQAGLQELIDQEDELLQQRAETEQLIAEQQQEIESTRQSIAELEEQSQVLSAEMSDTEIEVQLAAERASALREGIAEASEEMETARAEGAAAYEQRASNLAQARQEAEAKVNNLQAVVSSDLAQRTAASLVDTDPAVVATLAGREQATAAKNAVGQTISQTLGAGALNYAEQLAQQATSGQGLGVNPQQLRDGLVNSVPELNQLQTQYQSAMTAQQSAMTSIEDIFFAGPRNAARTLLGVTGAQADNLPMVAAARERMNSRIAQLAGVDLSTIPAVDASGNPLPMVERIALGMLARQGATDLAAAANPGTLGSAASGYQARIDAAVGREFGITPTQALNDPNAALNAAADLVPTDRDSAIDVAEQMLVARVRLDGALQDAAMQEAAAQDPTGTLAEVNNIEAAAEQAFADTYGQTPEEMLISYINGQADAARAADTPEEMLELYLQNNMPQAALARDVIEGMRNGAPPDQLLAMVASSSTGGRNNPLSINNTGDAANAGRTGLAMQDAAITQAEVADRTGTLRAVNDVRGAVDAEFAAVFGGSPEELALNALEDPEAAAGQLLELGEDLFSNPEGATLEAVNIVGSGAVSAASSALNTARNQLEVLAGPLGGVGEAMTTIADWGGDIVGGAIDFAGDLFGFGGGGPSDAEIAAAQAFVAQQARVAELEQQQAEDQAIMAYLEQARAVAESKYRLAVGVEKAKDQVSQYVLNAKVESRREQEYQVTRQASTEVIREYVQNNLEQEAGAAQRQLQAVSGTPEELAARANAWRAGS
ncbi:YDG domain-containing protein [Pseudohongiella sp. O18]|uniref:YDG domain-containing protein n=1 Tax=Pseudohongiella sp. O18 TaxID=2904248 RepID=UPI001F3C3FEF|nr:YDG domain-containing protein [Pseudohongiella sp. O18]